MEIKPNILRALFKNVYFINGTSYAGKSTMVKLLALKYNGICCNENYHEILMQHIDPVNQPNLSYIRDLKDYQDFVNRTPKQYHDWIQGCSREAGELEIIRLLQLVSENKPIFVDTNIDLAILKQISSYNNVAIMVSPQSMSVDEFFNRDDPDKKWIYNLIMTSSNPQKTMENYKNCLRLINSQEHYNEFLESGFYVISRNDNRTIEETLEQLEKHFLLR